MIAIIAYGAGNTGSVSNALSRLSCQHVITADPEVIRKADKVIIPGVGAAAPAMLRLKELGLDRLIVSLQQPVLGICLGMQLLCRSSEEGATECLGIFDTEVRRFRGAQPVPHMGWNSLEQCRGPLFANVPDKQGDVYFVHSFYAAVCRQTIAVCNYMQPFSAALQQDNFFATQFHPEKSGNTGALILKNFTEL
ncbi:imidazole glycerol phosphate synthase subunit HisH [Rurimicrobium arvi]|uniref:Imidazole glycerol phosphate synthase subunit HisH n=1 Tax=Rurimicrobium arvi TaxID=2049916 RepID=A0ABP8N1A6_9BACT